MFNNIFIVTPKKSTVDDENEESSYITDPNKENNVLKDRIKKKVTFEDLEKDGITVHEDEIRKLQSKIDYLTEENQSLKLKLNEKK